MKRLALMLAAAIGAGLVAGSPAGAVNYDCSKPGNANKTACKTQAAKPAPAAKATPAKAPPAAKAAPAAKPAPMAKAAPAPKTTAARNYDCSKPGNANKTACKGAGPAAAVAPAAAKVQPAATKPAPATAKSASAAAKPAAAASGGAIIAQCKDGTLSHSAQRSGACSQHGGVAAWR